jgi:hypothetical protein
MTRGLVLALVFIALNVDAADVIVVRGEVTFTKDGFARIAECGAKRVFQFGVMASSPYFDLVRRYEELSLDGRKAVLIEAQGVPARADGSTDADMLERPKVVSLTPGSCQ